MKQIRPLVALLFATLCVALQAQVSFTVSQRRVSPTEIDLVFTGKISPQWHVYGTGIADGGPTAAAFHVETARGAELAAPLQAGSGMKSMHDPVFDMQVTYFEQAATFTQRIRLTEPNYELDGYLEWGACNDANCLPPQSTEASVRGTDGPAAVAVSPLSQQTPAAGAPEATAEGATPLSDSEQPLNAVQDTAVAAAPEVFPTTALADSALIQAWYAPAADALAAFGEASSTAGGTLWYIFLMGLVGGLIALFTPCVWPIIPMTVSFFLHRSDNRRRAVRDALVYGLSIVVIYVGLGLMVTALFGASALNDLSTNAVFNLFVFAMLLVFAASFLGGFDITLPDSWNNRINSRASGATGWLGLFLMAFTLALVSFSCTGPIIGFLLVEVSTEGGTALAPTIGMLGFAIALALPFTLFALFPTLLKSAPKSGGWMNVVKVTLGFVELAFALKFLSVADLAYGWHLLDRETFLALWIAIFALLAAYLFGWLKFPHDDDSRRTTVPRFFLGLCSLAFSLYMVPGLWGAPCKAVSAFAPPITTQDFNLDPVKVEAKFRDYEQGMAYARQVGKPVLLDFTGFGCVNCRKMELAVWHDARVRDILNDDYVLISLYVDDKTRLPQPVEVAENGRKVKLRTVGDKWSYLQRTKFGAQTQPFYLPVDNEGRPLNHSYSYREDVGAYRDFLQQGLSRYRESLR